MDLPLIDHHCHGVTRGPLDRAGFESLLTESDRPPPPGCSAFDTLLGMSLRRRCPPVLDLAPGADPDQYLARRAELGADEVNRRLLSAAALEALLVDTGLGGGELTDLVELARLTGASTHEVVRLELLAEEVAAQRPGADEFANAFADRLAERAAGAIGLKSIIAYRHGFGFDPRPPSPAAVRSAADRWLTAGGGRVDDPVLLRHLLWAALETGLPLQMHGGFGDPDEDLRSCDPALLTDFLRACAGTGATVILLHCYPYHRNAAYLANVYPHVYLDLGLAIPHVGQRAAAVLAETLELAPFHKLLFSSDAYGLAELYLLAAEGFREALDEVTGALGITGTERDRLAMMIGTGNAQRIYALPV